MRQSRYRYTLCLLMLVLLSCTPMHLPTQDENMGEPADLSITISIPNPMSWTKSATPGYRDGTEETTGWGDWEKIVDGRQIYNITLMIIRKRDDCLVAYRHFYLNNEGHLVDFCNDQGTYGQNGFWNESSSSLYADTEQYTAAVKASFKSAHPMHGSIETITTGAYRLIAVANYWSISNVTSSDATTQSYSGLDGFTNAMATLLSNFNGTTGIQSFSTTASNILDYRLYAAKRDNVDQFICEQKPQPLTLIQDFSVQSGTNTISGQLIRSYSRIRIEVTNESEVDDLEIRHLQFPEPFAQSQTSLFDFSEFGGDSPFKPEYMGCPVVSSPDAIIPYVSTISIGRMETNPHNKYNSQAVFDAYILESQRGDNHYSVEMEVYYSDELTPPRAILWSSEGICTTSAFDQWFNEKGCDLYIVKLRGAFMFDNNSTNYFPVASGATELYTGNPPIQLDKPSNFPGPTETVLASDKNKYVWHISKESSSPVRYSIHNYLSTNRYLGYMPGKSGNANRWIPLVAETDKRLYIMEDILVGGNPTALGFQGIEADADKYLNLGNNDKWLKWTTREFASDEGSQFTLFPVRIGTEPHSITVQVIDEVSGQPHDLREIRRNDFVTMHVSVIFHPDPYDLRFIVQPWKSEKEEPIQFD